MRIDARNLLDRLGRSDFAYREFEDRFSELELWPILEALLRDPRLQALDQAEKAEAEKVVTVPSTETDQAEMVSGEPLSALFSRYGGETEAGPPAVERRQQPEDVRAMLRHLSDLGERGEI